MDLRLDSLPFDLLYANVKARANNSASKLSSGPHRGPATHGLDVIVIFGYKGFPVNFIFGSERLPVNFVLTVTTGDDQIHHAKVASTREMGTRLTTRAAARPSSFRKGRIGVDIPTSGAFSTAGASRTPKDDDADNEDDDDEDLSLDDITTTSALGKRTSDERGTLWTHRLWINFFFVILAMSRLKR
jgi:hypothetical protein